MLSAHVYEDENAWDIVLDRFGLWDVGHTFEYHALSQRSGEGSPILLVVEDEQGAPILIWPGLLRRIKGSDRLDMTSAYGYGGPVARTTDRAEECVRVARDALRELGVIDVFARMHPILGRSLTSSTSLKCRESGAVVLIDLREQPTTVESYGAGLRYDIRNLKDAGVESEIDVDCAGMGEFRTIYEQAMRNLHAESFYLFNDEYFDGFVKARKWRPMLIFARFRGVRIGAGLFLVANDVMHYHLGGAVREFRNLSPLKIILESAHRVAIDRGLRYLVLGGGVGSRQDDLFRFKRRFGRTVLPFYLVKEVVDDDAYREMCDSEGVEPDPEGFFPSYRSPLSEQ